jgi:hypothetical protein
MREQRTSSGNQDGGFIGRMGASEATVSPIPPPNLPPSYSPRIKAEMCQPANLPTIVSLMTLTPPIFRIRAAASPQRWLIHRRRRFSHRTQGRNGPRNPPGMCVKPRSHPLLPCPTIHASKHANRGRDTHILVPYQVSVHHIHTINSPPVNVVIVGNIPELGDWDINKAITLETDPVSCMCMCVQACITCKKEQPCLPDTVRQGTCSHWRMLGCKYVNQSIVLVCRFTW